MISGGHPQLFDRFDDALAEEDGTLVIVSVEISLLVMQDRLSFEVILVIQEIHLKLCIRNRSNLNRKGLLFTVYTDINSGQADHLMQTVAALIDDAELGHKDANVVAFFLNLLWEKPNVLRSGRSF